MPQKQDRKDEKTEENAREVYRESIRKANETLKKKLAGKPIACSIEELEGLAFDVTFACTASNAASIVTMVLPEDVDALEDIAQEAINYFERFKIFSKDLRAGLDVSATIVPTKILCDDELVRLSNGARMAIIMDEAMYVEANGTKEVQNKCISACTLWLAAEELEIEDIARQVIFHCWEDQYGQYNGRL